MPDISPSLSFIVLGSDAQVGSALVQLLEERSIPFKALDSFAANDSEELTAFLTKYADTRYVINALFNDTLDVDEARLSVLKGTSNKIASMCAAHGQVLFQLSSGHVFSGQSPRSYVETDELDADSTIGKLLQEMETSAANIQPQSIILRAAWLFSEQENNFLTRLVSAAIHQETLSFSGRMKGCPTDAHAVAKAFVAMAEQVDCQVQEPSLWGVYHYADSDACSMHTFAKTVITVVKSMAEVRVETIEELGVEEDSDVPTENYELSCKKVLSTFGIKQRPWRRSVHDVLKKTLSEASDTEATANSV